MRTALLVHKPSLLLHTRFPLLPVFLSLLDSYIRGAAKGSLVGGGWTDKGNSWRPAHGVTKKYLSAEHATMRYVYAMRHRGGGIPQRTSTPEILPGSVYSQGMPDQGQA